MQHVGRARVSGCIPSHSDRGFPAQVEQAGELVKIFKYDFIFEKYLLRCVAFLPNTSHDPAIVGLVRKPSIFNEPIAVSVPQSSLLHHNTGLRPHCFQVVQVFPQTKVPKNLQDKLQIEISPVSNIVDRIGVDVDEWIFLCKNEKIIILKGEGNFGEITWIPNVMWNRASRFALSYLAIK